MAESPGLESRGAAHSWGLGGCGRGVWEQLWLWNALDCSFILTLHQEREPVTVDSRLAPPMLLLLSLLSWEPGLYCTFSLQPEGQLWKWGSAKCPHSLARHQDDLLGTGPTALLEFTNGKAL